MIFLDPRFGETKQAPGSERLAAFKKDLEGFGADVVVQQMEFGDAAFIGNGPDGPIKVGIELKTIKDLINGMQTKRLAGHQIPGLLETYGRTYLVVEGFYRAGRPSGILEMPYGRRWRGFYAGKRPIFWADVEKFLTGLEEVGVRLRRTRTPHETARVIAQVLQGFWNKDYAAHRSLDVVYTAQPLLNRDDEATARIRRVLVALKSGVGDGRSKDVARAFGSIYGLVTADVNAWSGVEGIGKTIAAKTVQAIRAEIPGSTRSKLQKSGQSAPPNLRNSRRREDKGVRASRRTSRAVRTARRGHRSAD